VTDLEHGAVTRQCMETPGGDAVLDRSRPEAERPELRCGDDTCLATGERRDVLVDVTRVSFGLHISL